MCQYKTVYKLQKKMISHKSVHFSLSILDSRVFDRLQLLSIKYIVECFWFSLLHQHGGYTINTLQLVCRVKRALNDQTFWSISRDNIPTIERDHIQSAWIAYYGNALRAYIILQKNCLNNIFYATVYFDIH